ncbi:MAG: sulfate ABC transporter substrate-binding protein [Verrucomicrobia bacterium]|nr:sulfate ABC transporter substrate-binding protein [Verrucomicrobiota bacterium]
MKDRWINALALTAVAVAAVALVTANIGRDPSHELLNVSYDATRELFAELNAQFVPRYEKETGRKVVIRQSHGGSSRQARAVIEGLAADVVTLALPVDVDALRKQGLIANGWQQRLPNNSHPYTSTIVFVVRRGNPKQIKDWPDLIRPGVSVVTPDPKTSGNGKLTVLAAWGSVVCRGGDDEQARDYLRQLLAHVPVLGAGARDATNTFIQENEGDVQLTWENEALRETEDSKGDLEVVYPPVSILAEPSVAWVDANVSRRKAGSYAKDYLAFLYTEQAQEILARHGYRPSNPEVLKRHAGRLPRVNLFPITALVRDWDEAQAKFFAENGIFDVIHQTKVKQ